MPKIDLYTMDHCPFCERAKALLKQRGIVFKEHRVPLDDDAQWDSLYQRSKMRTMPQVFADDKIIGGYSDLAALDEGTPLTQWKKS